MEADVGQLAYTEDCAVLGNGTLMPLAGFGTWELRGGACSELVSLALRLGGAISTPPGCTARRRQWVSGSGKAAFPGRKSSSRRS